MTAYVTELPRKMIVHVLHVRNKSGTNLNINWEYTDDDKRLCITIKSHSEGEESADIHRNTVSED